MPDWLVQLWVARSGPAEMGRTRTAPPTPTANQHPEGVVEQLPGPTGGQSSLVRGFEAQAALRTDAFHARWELSLGARPGEGAATSRVLRHWPTTTEGVTSETVGDLLDELAARVLDIT